mgnify:CR=1 FL=1
MANVKHLLLDVNVIIDLWLGVGSEELTQEIFDLGRKEHVKLWITSASIATIDYVAKRAFKQRGVPPEELRPLIANLMDDLFEVAGVLSNHGFEQKEVYEKSIDFEDGQIASALRSLRGVPVCIVSEDSTFDHLGEVSVKSPMEALTWLYRESNDDQQAAIPFINLSAQQARVRPQIEQGIENVLRHGKYIMGPEVFELEERLADYVGVKHCISCASGTDALLMALMAKGVGPGDAIFTTPFTFVATGEVISLLGATPVFVDIDPRTFNIDAQKLEQAVKAVDSGWSIVDGKIQTNNHQPSTINRSEPSTINRSSEPSTINHQPLTARGVIPVDLFGLPADYDAINAIADKHDLFVLEDAAQGFGGTYKGRKAGSLAEIAATSFFPAKPLGCYGDGGAIFTNDDSLAEILKSIRIHGKGQDKYDNVRIGLNGRLDTIQAAILLQKLDIFPEEVQARQKAADTYTRLLSDLNHQPSTINHQPPLNDQRLTINDQQVSLPFVPNGYTSAWAQYSILLESHAQREVLQKHLQQQNIPTAVYYPKPLHLQTAYAEFGYNAGDFPIAEDVSQRILSLPMGPYLHEGEQKKIVKAILK